MTLEQSEFQRLVELVMELLERYRGDPAAVEAILSEFRDLYKKIPIYPGIITMCLPKVVRPAEVDKLKEGDEVVLSLKGGQIVSGRVTEVGLEKIELAGCKQLSVSGPTEKVSVERGSVEKAERIVRGVLEKEWPSLDFEG